MKLPVKIILILVLLASAAAGAWFANTALRQQASVPLQHGTRITPPRELPVFNLVSHEGKPFKRRAPSVIRSITVGVWFMA